ncbi:hypothetical protein BGZ94_007410 [Podila epigama]|nr:hypothetical protein BGZ94_007410 [Podila epigama]
MAASDDMLQPHATGHQDSSPPTPTPTPAPMDNASTSKNSLDEHQHSNNPLSPELVSALRVCLRSYGVGYVFATAPKLVKTLLAFVLHPRKAAKGQNPLVALIRSILVVLRDGASARKDGMSMLLMITLGGYKLLELFINRGVKKAILMQQLQQQLQQQQQQNVHAQHENGITAEAPPQPFRKRIQLSSKDLETVELTPDMKQRVTMLSSFLSSAAAILFMHRYRARHATIDYSLFAVVRALDVGGHVAVKNNWGPSWLGTYGALAVFVMSCTEIMYSWLYDPSRLPGPYAFWITRMARMDKRLLETLRGIRDGSIQFKSTNPPHVAGLLTGLCDDLGLDPAMGDFERRSRLSCKVVHQGIADSCEAHTAYRWAQGFMVSAGIYLPVHLLPALLSPKSFIKKLQENPVTTLSSTLLATARSSAFLATYIALIWYGICTWRSKVMPLTMKLTGRRYTSNVVDNIYGPLLGCFLCGFSVVIEKPHRRAEMALYVLPRAMYSMWSRVMSGRLSRRVEATGEALMYAISMSILVTGMKWKRDMVRPSMQGLLGWMLEMKGSRRHQRWIKQELKKGVAVIPTVSESEPTDA